MNLDRVVEDLKKGPVTFKTKGGSMTPKIRSGETVTVAPIADHDVARGDIVIARVGGRLYLHLVTATEKDRVQISNNHGHVNGWTSRANVFGILP